MSERSFNLYQAYAARRMLPARRMQLQLARIALTVAQANGGNARLSLADFLFDPPTDEEDASDDAVLLEFKPRNVKA